MIPQPPPTTIQQGKPEEALELYKKVMAIDIKSLGKDHPDMAITYNNLAGLCKDQVSTRTRGGAARCPRRG